MRPLGARGRDAAAPVRDWMARALPAGEHARVWAVIAQAVARRAEAALEHLFLRRGGGEGRAFSRAVPVLDDAGDPVERLVVVRDVTETRRAQEAWRESERRFRAVLEQSTGGIAQVDLEARFVLVNDRYCGIVGRSRDQLLAMRMQDLTHPEDAPSNLALFDELAPDLRPGFTIEKRSQAGRIHRAGAERGVGDPRRRRTRAIRHRHGCRHHRPAACARAPRLPWPRSGSWHWTPRGWAGGSPTASPAP